ncbi:MAG: PEP-CTERM sorting domain-containing protein [Pirellulales bacterium]|nr:PEP-CTERM sorting domain-containing protein [Pirellulales bacterium]
MRWKYFCLLAAMAALITSPALAVDPVIHYTFESGSLANSGTGGATYDGVIYDTLDADPTGDTAIISGPVGDALDLINTQDNPRGAFLGANYVMPDQGTLAMWYQVGNPGFYNHEPVFDMVEAVATPTTTNTYGSALGNVWEAWIYSDGLLRGRVNAPVNNYFESYDADLRALSGANGAWYHFAVSWDKNDTSGASQKFYINGQLSSTASIAWEAPGAVVCFGGGHTTNDIGTGAYDDIRIYDSVVSASEIATLAGTSGAVTVPTPVIHYDFEGDLANRGSGGAALNGVYVDGGAGSLSYTTGVVGGGISYDNAMNTLTDGDFVKVGYTLPDAGAISVWVKPTEHFDYNSVWDNSVHQEDFECWIYNDGRVRARANNDGSADCQFHLDDIHGYANGGDETGWEDAWYQVTWTWSKTEDCGSLYINGKIVDTDNINAWVDPGSEFYLGGGNPLNELFVGDFDELKIFESYLTSAQAKAIYDADMAVPEPGTLMLLLSALLFCGLRRGKTA